MLSILPPLLDQVRDAIRGKHYPYRTEETYVQWILRHTLFHYKRHLIEMGKAQIEAVLTHLAVEAYTDDEQCRKEAFSAGFFEPSKKISIA